MALPNFLCVGAQRCGTTTLHHLLRQHNQIFVPLGRKEPHFFDNPLFYQRGIADYERQVFLDHMDELAIGEITPSYMAYEPAAARIRKALGSEVKLIFCLRDPAARAYSHYISNYSKLYETESFDQALSLEAKRLSKNTSENLVYGYIYRGYYYQHINRFLEHFDLDQMFFILFETDIAHNTRNCMTQLFQFLGVPTQDIDCSIHADRSRLPDVQFVKNDMTLTIKNKQVDQCEVHIPAGGIIINRPRSGLEIVRQPSAQFRAQLEVWQQNKPTSLCLNSLELRAVRETYFREEIQLLENFLNRDLSIWCD
jgi:hypothetical protein